MSGKITVGKICEQLNNFLSKFSDSLGIDDEEDIGAKVHPYGPLNTYNELGDIHQVITAIKTRCDQLKVSGNAAVNLLKSSIEAQHQEEIANPLKSCLKNCIEKLRNATQDLTIKTVIQKLQAISEESCLRFDNGGQSGTDFFISSDMFYFEIKLDTFGKIIDVREQLHSGEPKSCKELVEILRKGDYDEFKTRLKRLADLYKIKVDTFMKSSKIFAALEAVEKDIIKLSTSKTEGNSLKPYEILQYGPVGYVFKRQGGHLMQLNYFAAPTELLKKDEIKLEKDEELPTSCRGFGFSASIAVESSKVHRLPISQLLIIDASKDIRYEILDNNNSDELPASFVMRLTNPFSISASLLCEIHTILTKTAAKDFVHSSEASLDNLIIKQHLELKNREEWAKKLFQIDLPDQEHVYRLNPCDASSNVGFIISRIPFHHPSQVLSIIKVLRRQAIYSCLLTSCLGKRNINECGEKSEYFSVKAVNSNTIQVTFQHPLHTSMASVSFSVQEDNTVKTSINCSSDAPEFCTSSYLDKVANRCLSIPITMRSLLRKAAAYIPPSSLPSNINKSVDKVEEPSRPKQLKLLIPALSIENSMSVPLVSPGIYSSSAFPTFSLSSGSPSTASFQFPMPESGTTIPVGYGKPAFSSPRKPKDFLGKPSTPGTPKSRTLKLPKITLKRKRDGDEYEIDKEKSNFDVLEETEAQTIADSLSNESKQDEARQQSKLSSTGITEIKSHDVTLTTGNMPIDLSVESLPTNAINISSVGELEGLLGPGIDVSTLMGENLGANFGITGSPFPDTISNSAVGENQIEAFDLEAITSGGSHINFGVDDSLPSAAVVDPSMVVSSSSTLANTPMFDVNQSLIDIDSFIMGPIPNRSSTPQLQNDQST